MRNAAYLPWRLVFRGCLWAISILIAALSFWVAPTSAATITNDRPLLFSFDGSDSSSGRFNGILAIAADESTGDLYAINAAGEGKGPTGYGPEPGEWDDERVVCKFNAAGEAQTFTAGSSAGKSCLDGRDIQCVRCLVPEDSAFGMEGFFADGAYFADVAIDNSSVNPGRIYVSEEGGPIHAFDPSGAYLWTLPRKDDNGTPLDPSDDTSIVEEACGIGVDTEGHLLVGTGSREVVLKFASTGSPPAQIGSVMMTNANKRPCRLAIDEGGENLYVGLREFNSLDKYRHGVYDSTLSAKGPFDVTIDQSKAMGHVFAGNEDGFHEYEPCGQPGCILEEAEGSPFGRDLIGNARGIAHGECDPPGPTGPFADCVYVSDKASNAIKVFGPVVTSGTAPDVSCQNTEPVDLHSATALCTINPLSLPNSYHFEWKPCASVECAGPGDASWAAADSSPSQSIEPADSNPHSVSLALSEYHGKRLRSNTWFAVRLVGTNAENQLGAYASPDVFQTFAPDPAEIVGCDISTITTQSAHVACIIDPNEDETDWSLDLATLPGATPETCKALGEAKFDTVATGTDPGENPGTFEIATDLTGLLPAQGYCVLALAANPAPPADKEDLSFATGAVAPSEASAAFAAPRSDTTARINGRANPKGDAAITGGITYRFELSSDGTNWTPRPILHADIDGREPIVLADELIGLQPDTTYHYRFGLIESNGGGAASLGEERTFTTRTSTEVQEASPPACPQNEDVRAFQHSAYLGACRGIELVNNPYKGNQNAYAYGPGYDRSSTSSPMSANGEKVLWSVIGGAPGAPNGSENSFLAERGMGGWNSHSVAPPNDEQVGEGNLVYFLLTANPGFSSFLFSARYSAPLVPPPSATFVRMRYGEQDILKSNSGTARNSALEKSVDVSDDGEHVFTIDPATAQLEDIGGARLGPPEVQGDVVSIMPDGKLSECGMELGNALTFRGTAASAAGRIGDHWIATTDGSRVYFRARPNGECGKAKGEPTGAYGLYVRNREAGEVVEGRPTGKTTLIDPGASEFLRAGSNGRQAYFITRSDHSDLASLDPAEVDTDPDSTDLYHWDENAGPGGESRCLTCTVPLPAHLAEDGGAPLSVRISDNFAKIYFFSREKAVPGQGAQGELNLYVLSDGQIRFVATVDGSQPGGNALNRAVLSNDGEVLLFSSQARSGLSADRVADRCIGPDRGPEDCFEVYRYDDHDRSIECISCNHKVLTASSVGDPGIWPRPRLSADGTTAAFATSEALVGADVNRGIDLYEWRAGTWHLLTDGVSNYQGGVSTPQVWALDADGSDILFGVVPPAGRLTGFERDGVLNLYDARIDGGFLLPSPQQHCEGDSCQGPLQAEPASPTPASSIAGGAGNVSERPNCGALARQASWISSRIKRLHHAARRADAAKSVRRMRSRAASLAKRADRIGKHARHCRRANRRAAQ